MATQDPWGGNRVWTINYASDTLAPVLMVPNNAGRTQFKLNPIQDGDAIVGYDVVPLNLPSAWTSAPCRFFCFGSVEPQWPFGLFPLAFESPKRPLPSYEQNPEAHHSVATALQRNYGARPSVARLQGEIHVGSYKTPETVSFYKVEDVVIGSRAFLLIVVQADLTLLESGVAHGND